MNWRVILKQALYAYPIPLAVIVVSILDGSFWGGAWFGGGRPGWAVLTLSLPWTAARMLVLASTGGVVRNKQQRRVAATLGLTYPLVALACAAAIALAMGYVNVRQLGEYLLLLFFPFTVTAMM
jgi:hypothetical protein